MARFDIFYPIILKNEGGYANKPNDTGGETWAGISRNNWPGWPGWPVVDSYRPQSNFPTILHSCVQLAAYVEEFYKKREWDPIMGDDLHNQSIADFLADWAVNAGNSVPIKHVQEILGFTGEDEDGIMGLKTLAAINGSSAGEIGLEFFDKLKAARHQFYLDVVAKHPADKEFLSDWQKRTDSFQY